MASIKISELNEYTEVKDDDLFPIVDVANGETKKIKVSNIDTGIKIVNSLQGDEIDKAPSVHIVNEKLNEIFNKIYPIGSLYMSVNSTNPNILFGGTWKQIDGYYLYAGTGGKIAGSNTSGIPSTNVTGSTVLTINQIPAHTHTADRYKSSGDLGASNIPLASGNKIETATTAVNSTGGGKGHTHTLSNHTHNITPLRYEIYAWKRTA